MTRPRATEGALLKTGGGGAAALLAESKATPVKVSPFALPGEIRWLQ